MQYASSQTNPNSDSFTWANNKNCNVKEIAVFDRIKVCQQEKWTSFLVSITFSAFRMNAHRIRTHLNRPNYYALLALVVVVLPRRRKVKSIETHVD